MGQWQNMVFGGIYLNSQRQNSLKNQYLPYSESKSYQINSIKSCSSRSFQQHQRHIPIPPKFWATIYFNLSFSEEIIQYSKTCASQVQTIWNQAHAPFLDDESFPKPPRTLSEAYEFDGCRNCETKQTTFLHR